MLSVTCVPLGPYMTNCYILKDESSGEFAVIDPGFYDAYFEDRLQKIGVEKVSLILLTHGHFDHICGVYALQKNFGGRVLIHGEDGACLEDENCSFAASTEEYRQQPVTDYSVFSDGDKIAFGDTVITVMHTPGHTRGGCCFIAENNMFSGDTLFKVGVGRTDLPGGHLRTLCRSLERIGALSENYNIFPGHGESTTLDNEKSANILLRAK